MEAETKRTILNWCYRLSIASTATPTSSDDSRAPTNPVKLFAWICAQNWPQLEDELPPPGFNEIFEMADIHQCGSCDRLLICLDARLRHRSIGTQTAAAAVAVAAAAAQQLRAQLKAQQTERQLVLQFDEQTQTEEQQPEQQHQQQQQEEEEEHRQLLEALPLTGNIEAEQTQSLLATVQRAFAWRLGGRSIWSMLKTLLVLISLLHSCYLLGGCIYRLPMLRQLIQRAQSICTPAPPPPPRTLPAFIWGQLCRLARKLHIV